MDRTRWIIFGVICMVVIGALAFNKKPSDVQVVNLKPSKVITSDKNGSQIPDHTYGSTSMKVVLMEYGDFQCPGCGGLFPTMKELKEKYKDQMTFVFRNFPLVSIHPNALAAATSAEAAGLQGKWWEYHDKLYENQGAWSNANIDERSSIFEKYAKELELDTAKFKKDFENEMIKEKIERDQALGKKHKVSSTPTLILNGKTLPFNEWAESGEGEKKLEAAIVKAIKKSEQSTPQ